MSGTCMKISSVEYEKDSVKPVLCDFQNGKVPEGFENHMVSQMYRDKDGELLIAVAANNQLYTDKIKANKTHNTFLAIPNSKRTKVRLVAIDYAKLVPHFDEATDGDTQITLNRELDFTNKKAKRILNEKTKLKQNIELVKDHLIETVADISTDQVDLNSSVSETVYKIKLDVDADRIEHVYNLHDIVPEDVLESLGQEAERIFNEDDSSGLSEYVADHLNQFDDIDSVAKRNACLIWLYIDCLIKFINTNAKALATKKYRACSYSTLANNDIMQKFTVQGATGRNRPSIMRDKCLCHVLVLCLINSNYKMDVALLVKYINWSSIKRITEFAKVHRLTVKGTIVSLKLPLPAVQEVKSNKRRR